MNQNTEMNKIWKKPPILKIFEALGAIADGRINEVSDGIARVTSSDRTKTYTVRWNPTTREVYSDDNASHWQGYLGYPAIAYLMKKGILPFDAQLAKQFAGIEWKKLNSRFRHHETVINYLATELRINIAPARIFAEKVISSFSELHLQKWSSSPKKDSSH